MKLCRLCGPVGHRHLTGKVFRIYFRVFDAHIEVSVSSPVRLERIKELVLRFILTARCVDLDEVLIGKGDLRIFVDHFRVGMGRKVVGKEPVVLYIFAVISLGICEPEGALFQPLVQSIPQC